MRSFFSEPCSCFAGPCSCGSSEAGAGGSSECDAERATNPECTTFPDHSQDGSKRVPSACPAEPRLGPGPSVCRSHVLDEPLELVDRTAVAAAEALEDGAGIDE